MITFTHPPPPNLGKKGNFPEQLTYVQGLNDFNDVTFAFDDIDDDDDEGLNGIIDVTFAFNDNNDDEGSIDLKEVTFVFDDVLSRREKLQRMWGNIWLLKKHQRE